MPQSQLGPQQLHPHRRMADPAVTQIGFVVATGNTLTVLHLHSFFLKGAQSLLWLGRRQTDRYALSGVPDLSLEDKHVPDTHPCNRLRREAWLIRPGEGATPGGSVTQRVGCTAGPWIQGCPALPILCSIWPGPLVSELKPEMRGLRRHPK